MSTITKVALAGASGNLGPAILEQLVEAGFQVTVLTRPSSNHTFPPSVRVQPVDYDSIESLTSALTGQDAVVSTLASTALEKQLHLVEAAAKAHVKRFIPSEFGSDTLHEKTSTLPVFAPKVKVLDALKKHAATPGGLTYTAVVTGPFLDWGIKVGFVLNVKEKSVNLFDGGERTFSATTLPSIGKTVVAVLRHLEETKNRAVYVQSTATTSKKLLELGKKATGAQDWTENSISSEEIAAKAWEELKQPQPNPDKFVLPFIQISIWGEGYGSHFQKLDNELLGIPQLSEAELLELIRSYA